MSVLKRYKGKRLKPRDKDWNKGTWYVWKRLNGRIIHRAIPEAQTKEQAEQAERKIIEAVFNHRYGIADNVTTIAHFSEKYLRYVESHNVNKTAKKQYVEIIKKRFGRRLLCEITPQDCRDFRDTLKLSNSSKNRIMSTLSRMFTLACEEELLERSPMEYVKGLQEPAARNRVLTSEEKHQLWIELEKDPLLMRLVTLACNLPLRRGQLLAIKPEAVDLQNSVLFAIGSKGQPPRMVPLNESAKNTLRQMIADKQLPFPLKDFRKRWIPALVHAGINKEGAPRGENFTFHDLRHYLASELINRHNVNPETVRQLFDHSDMSITRIYMNSDFEVLKSALNQMDATNLRPPDGETGLPN